MIRLYNRDCMAALAEMPDKCYELAIVDPQYGIKRFQNGIGKNDRHTVKADGGFNNNVPTIEYFNELFRISNYQIIWGANNFRLSPTEYFIVWDKQQTVDNFASAEYAWTNYKTPAKVFRYSIHQHNQIDKIHPTQKPVKLYEWLLLNYAKQGDRILDTHGGSMSIAIACHNLGFDLDLYEIDVDYFEAGKKRLEEHQRQGRMFDIC